MAKKEITPAFIFTVDGALYDPADHEEFEGREQWRLSNIQTVEMEATKFFQELANENPQKIVRMYQIIARSEPQPPRIVMNPAVNPAVKP